eukprot:13251973-Ditylum_brightwellii.AAC.1
MFAIDQLIFSLPLKDRLSFLSRLKQHWLEVVGIAVYGFQVIHKRYPNQCVMSQPQDAQLWSESGMGCVPELD